MARVLFVVRVDSYLAALEGSEDTVEDSLAKEAL